MGIWWLITLMAFMTRLIDLCPVFKTLLYDSNEQGRDAPFNALPGGPPAVLITTTTYLTTSHLHLSDTQILQHLSREYPRTHLPLHTDFPSLVLSPETRTAPEHEAITNPLCIPPPPLTAIYISSSCLPSILSSLPTLQPLLLH